jgi:hypothetical protein
MTESRQYVINAYILFISQRVMKMNARFYVCFAGRMMSDIKVFALERTCLGYHGILFSMR